MEKNNKVVDMSGVLVYSSNYKIYFSSIDAKKDSSRNTKSGKERMVIEYQLVPTGRAFDKINGKWVQVEYVK